MVSEKSDDAVALTAYDTMLPSMHDDDAGVNGSQLPL